MFDLNCVPLTLPHPQGMVAMVSVDGNSAELVTHILFWPGCRERHDIQLYFVVFLRYQ